MYKSDIFSNRPIPMYSILWSLDHVCIKSENKSLYVLPTNDIDLILVDGAACQGAGCGHLCQRVPLVLTRVIAEIM